MLHRSFCCVFNFLTISLILAISFILVNLSHCCRSPLDQCSAECFGTGVRSRQVFCGESDDSLEPTNVAVTAEDKCDKEDKLEAEEECQPESECPMGEWYAGPYSKVVTTGMWYIGLYFREG